MGGTKRTNNDPKDASASKKQRQQTPVQLLSQIIMMTRTFTKTSMEKKTVEDYAKLLDEQLDNVIGVAEELYAAYADDFREDSVHDVLCRAAGFKPKNGTSPAEWKSVGYAEWKESHEALEELKIVLMEAETPKKTPKKSAKNVTFAEEEEAEGDPSVPEAEAEGGHPGDPGQSTSKGLTPKSLSNDKELLEWAKKALAGEGGGQGPTRSLASGMTKTTRDLSLYDMPTMGSMASGLYFEENSHGVPTLKKTQKMSFERWCEWNGNLSDRIEVIEERRDYRTYTSHLIAFREQRVPWEVILAADTETREMIKSGELNGYGDPRILQRFLTKFRDVGGGGGGGTPRTPRNPNKLKVDWVKLGLCKFWNTKGRCAKGNDCDFKHEKPPRT